MMRPIVSLRNDILEVEVDAHGADIARLIVSELGRDVFFSTPWRSAAASNRATGGRADAGGSIASWMDRYQGGWQLLVPNAGPPRVQGGTTLDYHGEASRATWDVDQRDDLSVMLRTSLVSVPLDVDRFVRLDGASLCVRDRVRNRSAVPVPFDYVQHPAFGAGLIEGPFAIEVDATDFTGDPETAMSIITGERSTWPVARDHSGGSIDLSVVDGATPGRFVFGWLGGFSEGRAKISSLSSGMAVVLTWDAKLLPYAWLWQDLNANDAWPWFGSARVVAIEPANTITGGDARVVGDILGPGEEREFETTLRVEIPPVELKIG